MEDKARRKAGAVKALLAFLTVAVLAAFMPGDVSNAKSGGSSEIKIVIYGNTYNLEVKVVDKDTGKAIDGASIYIQSKSNENEWPFYGVTGSDGTKHLWMPISTQTIRIKKANYDTAESSFTVTSILEKKTVTIKLQKTEEEKPSGGGSSGGSSSGGSSSKPSSDGSTSKPSSGSSTTKPSSSGSSSKPSSSSSTTKPSSSSSSSKPSSSGSSSKSSSSGTSSSGSSSSSSSSGSSSSSSSSGGGSTQPQKMDSADDTTTTDDTSGETADDTAEDTPTEDDLGLGGGLDDETGSDVDSQTIIDLAVNVYTSEGLPASNLFVELHTDIWKGQLDKNGFILFEDIPMGTHTIYVQDRFGRTVGQKTFDINRSNTTMIETASRVSVSVAVATITVDVVCDEATGELTLESAWDGITDNAGNAVETASPNTAKQVNANILIRTAKDFRFWIWFLLWIILFILGFIVGRRRERKLLGEEEKDDDDDGYGGDYGDYGGGGYGDYGGGAESSGFDDGGGVQRYAAATNDARYANAGGYDGYGGE